MARHIKLFTNCFIFDADKVLLGYKKRGFGKDKWNGFGGKVEPLESIEDAARRELYEEAGITSDNLEKVGVITFRTVLEPQKIEEVHIFRSEEFNGTPVETEEMRPQWFKIKEVPYDEMWVDDRYWKPTMFKGIKFTAEFLFEGEDKVLEYKIIEQ